MQSIGTMFPGHRHSHIHTTRYCESMRYLDLPQGQVRPDIREEDDDEEEDSPCNPRWQAAAQQTGICEHPGDDQSSTHAPLTPAVARQSSRRPRLCHISVLLSSSITMLGNTGRSPVDDLSLAGFLIDDLTGSDSLTHYFTTIVL